jgi:hypothetical protein
MLKRVVQLVISLIWRVTESFSLNSLVTVSKSSLKIILDLHINTLLRLKLFWIRHCYVGNYFGFALKYILYLKLFRLKHIGTPRCVHIISDILINTLLRWKFTLNTFLNYFEYTHYIITFEIMLDLLRRTLLRWKMFTLYLNAFLDSKLFWIFRSTPRCLETYFRITH